MQNNTVKTAIAELQSPHGTRVSLPEIVEQEVQMPSPDKELPELEKQLYEMERKLLNLKTLRKQTRLQTDQQASERLVKIEQRLNELNHERKSLKAEVDKRIVKQKPTPVQRVSNYAKSTTEWIAAGRPVREESEIIYIREAYCLNGSGETNSIKDEPCKYLDKKGTCTECGCPVIRPTVLGYKLRRKTEHCPKGFW